MKLAANRTPTEESILALLLCELRKSAKHGGQMRITIDPFIAGRTAAAVAGAHVSVDHGSPQDTYTFDGPILRGKRR